MRYNLHGQGLYCERTLPQEIGFTDRVTSVF